MLTGYRGKILNWDWYRELDLNYFERMEEESVKEASTILTDWNHMKLKDKIEEGEDYILISHTLWKKLVHRFGGGPEIKFFICDQAEKSNNLIWQGGYLRGYPDKNPIIVDVVTEKEVDEVRVGILISKFCTPKVFQ